MVSTRALCPGDVILKEKICLHGPNLERSQPVCVVCYRLIGEATFAPCKRCAVPTCGTECMQDEKHKVSCCTI